MKLNRYAAEQLLTQMVQLDPVEFIGICTILNIDIFNDKEKKEVKPFEEVWELVCDKVWLLNRVQRKNLGRLIYTATKKKKKK